MSKGYKTPLAARVFESLHACLKRYRIPLDDANGRNLLNASRGKLIELPTCRKLATALAQVVLHPEQFAQPAARVLDFWKTWRIEVEAITRELLPQPFTMASLDVLESFFIRLLRGETRSTPLDSLLLPSFGDVHGFLPSRSFPTMRVPPLVNHGNGQLDFDYAILLLFPSFIIDKNAKEWIEANDLACHRQLRESLRILPENVSVRFENYTTITATATERLDSMVETNMNYKASWFPQIQQAVTTWKEDAPQLIAIHTPNVSGEMFTAFGLCHYLKTKHPNKFDPTHLALVENIFLHPERKLTKWQQRIKAEAVDFIARTYLRSACHALLLSQLTGSSLGDWRNYQGFHKRLTMPSADPRGVAIAEQAKSRSIFKFALPAIRKRPYSVHDFIKHHGSAHMLRMREFLREAAAHPEHKIEDAVFLNAFKLLATNPAEFEALAKAKGQDGQIAGLSSADSGWVAMLVENRSVNQSGQV